MAMLLKFLSFLFLAATSKALLIKARYPTVEMCSESTSSWLSDVSLNITPWPVHVAAGEIINADAEGTLLQTIDPGASVKLEMKLVTVLGDVVIPCLPISDFQIGSCTYAAEWLLEKLAGTGICESLMPAGQPCALPLNPGKYAEGDVPLVITVPDIPDALRPFLKGKVKVKALGIDASGQENFCLSLLMELN